MADRRGGARGLEVSAPGQQFARTARKPASAALWAVAAHLAGADGCRTLLSELPSLDVLVNNLGIFEPKRFEQITDKDWLRFFEINALSGIRLAHHYVTRMQERNWAASSSCRAGRTRSHGADEATLEREFVATARPSSILQRFASSDEVAAMIVYLCSGQASATTRSAVRLDGRAVRSIAPRCHAVLTNCGSCTSWPRLGFVREALVR